MLYLLSLSYQGGENHISLSLLLARLQLQSNRFANLRKKKAEKKRKKTNEEEHTQREKKREEREENQCSQIIIVCFHVKYY